MTIAHAPVTSLLRPPGRLTAVGLATGVLALITLIVVCLATVPAQFFHSWLYAWTCWIGVTLGCEVVLMINYCRTGGTWGVPLRRLLEAGAMTMLPMIVMFVPVLLGLSELYRWMDPHAVAGDAWLQHTASYLNASFFVVRTIIYFACWTYLAWRLNGWSLEQDNRSDFDLAGRLQRLSAGGLVLYGFTSTFAAIDWVMSLEPHWFSTIWGMIFWLLQSLSALSFVIVMFTTMAKVPPLDASMTHERLFEQGQLMTVMIMACAYCEFSQWVIYWNGNLPHEILFYLSRAAGGWGALALVVLFVGLFLPFFALLFGPMKRDANKLRAIAAVVFVGEMFHYYWLIVPSMPWLGYSMQLTYLLAMLAVGGLWLGFFGWWLGRRPLVVTVDSASVEWREEGP